ncbi:E3 ubiquitin-protein ligase rnf146-like [Mytilus galloprovincialis]|uniref:E3 ubiquitin-protein ligase n=1 Tax=Mytilus galloprovincialis TaxID=29158 RepID=A0A8B6E0E8_MYTGA|nr:E3 ubiquitin-protein ligase RNF146 [Mytilus galloprovincialis]
MSRPGLRSGSAADCTNQATLNREMARNETDEGGRQREMADQDDEDKCSEIKPNQQASTKFQNIQYDSRLTENGDPTIECSVCLQPSIYPVQLPCRHIFCFLCVKGVANRSKKCALCRQEIPADFFAKPVLVRTEDLDKTIKFDNEYQWFYEGRNGWWKYDDRTSQEIESRHKTGEKLFELLIAGFLYIIDLENMIQYRRNDRSRKRRIKRDLISIPDVKGVAGLKFDNEISSRLGGDGGEEIQSNTQPTTMLTSPDTDDLSVPNNTPQTPNTPVDSPPSSVTSSQQDLAEHLQQLNISGSSTTSL